MQRSLALLEFDGVATGLVAVDGMLKRSPVAVLRCGSIHPGRYLALVGGSVASTEEAHRAGSMIGRDRGALIDEVFLADPEPSLNAAVVGERFAPGGDAVGACEVSTSPGLIRGLDHVLKSVPVHLVEIRLADDLGGRALAIFDGRLPDVQEALEMLADRIAEAATSTLLASSMMPRVDDTLRDVLAAGTRFATCDTWMPAGAEILETER